MVKRINAIEGVMDTMQEINNNILTGGEPEYRNNALNDIVNDITIDTVKAFDTGMWETGINRESIEGKWIIVEQYDNKKKAKIGHKKWVELMQKNPEMEIKDLDLWGLEED